MGFSWKYWMAWSSVNRKSFPVYFESIRSNESGVKGSFSASEILKGGDTFINLFISAAVLLKVRLCVKNFYIPPTASTLFEWVLLCPIPCFVYKCF